MRIALVVQAASSRCGVERRAAFRLVQLIPVATLLLAAGTACRDTDVLTESYATHSEAAAAGAVDKGWLPRSLPPSSREIRVAHDLASARRWGLFNFAPDDEPRLRGMIGAEMSLAGQTCNPPRRVEWWPLLLREHLDQERIAATGLRAYPAREGDLIFAVNWNQGRAYYWTKE